MVALVLSALGARRAQTVALLLLTVLAGTGAAAAPWFLAWGRDAVADADLGAAPPIQRIVTATGTARYVPGAPSPTQQVRERVAQHLDIPGAAVVVGGRIYTTMTAGSGTAGLYLNYRDGICAQLRIEGACPARAGDVLLGAVTADQLGLHPGDTVSFEGFRLARPVILRVSGVYEVLDVLGAYWAGTDLLTGPAGVGTVVDPPAFTTEETLLGAGPSGFDLDVHLLVPPEAFHGSPAGAGLEATLDRATAQLRLANLEVVTGARDLIGQIRRDQRLVALGVTVAAAQLLLLCWFALFLAVRHTSEQSRPDIGLLKLRGTPVARTWALIAAQSAVPMVAGALLGWGLGYLAAGALAGDLGAPARTLDTDPGLSLRLSAVAAAIACLGALVAAVFAEWRVLRDPVPALLRRVPARRRGWRAGLGEVFAVVLAAVAVYQGRVEAASGEPSVFALLAPGLVGLAVALPLARAVPWLAGRWGGSALRSGRPGAALAALHLARRPGTHRLFAVVAVATGVFAAATFLWNTSTLAWADRAAQELGADRVLTVRAGGSAQLLAAVRAADPSGRYAMAVARTGGVRTEDRVLAVDTTRLGVAHVPGVDEATLRRLAGLLHPDIAPAPVIQDGPVTLDATGPPEPVPGRPLTLRLYLAARDGASTTVDIGPLAPGRHTYTAAVTGCAAGCRLVALEPLLGLASPTLRQATVELHALTAGATAVPLGDITRWRPQVGAVGIGNVLATRDGGLVISPFTGWLPQGQRLDRRVFVADAPTPLPAVLAGPRPASRRAGDERVSILGTERVAFRIVSTVDVLPRLGASGLLVDLEYAAHSVGVPKENAALEVWLAPGAPAGIRERLSAAGVQVLDERGVGAVRDQYAAQGPGVVLRFELFAGAVLLALAAGAIVVTATAERRARVEELAALRTQGLPEGAAAMAGYGGTAALVGSAAIAGVLAALLGQVIVTAALPLFADGWRLLPPPPAAGPGPVLTATLVALLVLGVAAAAGSARVVGTVEAAGRSPARTTGGAG